jgi:hypothetical protein
MTKPVPRCTNGVATHGLVLIVSRNHQGGKRQKEKKGANQTQQPRQNHNLSFTTRKKVR